MSNNLEVVLAVLKDEVNGDVDAALQKLTDDYTMTWMYQGKKERFPRSSVDLERELSEEVYPIKGRRYDIRNIAEGEDIVMVELIESYPDADTGFLHQTPLVLVLELKDGKIQTGRHYCDPSLSHESIEKEELETAYKNTRSKQVIE